MPGAVSRAGLANSVLPLNQIGPEILKRVQAHRTPAAAIPKGAL
jgi:chemotaxis response regulator CheB